MVCKGLKASNQPQLVESNFRIHILILVVNCFFVDSRSQVETIPLIRRDNNENATLNFDADAVAVCIKASSL